MAGVDSCDEESEVSSGAEDVDLPPPPRQAFTSRSSVSAEAFGHWNQRALFTPPVWPKPDEHVAWLIEVLKRSFLFQSLDDHDLQVVSLAMRGPLQLAPGHRIIQEGQSGDHLYVVQDGALDCARLIDGVERVVKTCVQGDLFGELALLYNCPRAASVVSRTDSTVWELDRETFNNIVMIAVQRKRTLYHDMLRKVPVFVNMSEGEMANIIDVLKLEVFPYGHTIVQQGQEGHHFFIVIEGQVIATKTTPDSPEPVTMMHQAGDYFGELSLLQNVPRAATVVVSTEQVKVLSMDRSTFKRLMGGCESLLVAGFDRYS
jgi:cAMP-dependent protein kinase regulator